MITGAPNAVFIFETDEDIMQWPEYFAPGRTSGERFRRVPISTVLDGVECLKNNAGTGPGRIVLKDSNNSTQDFVIVSGPVPRNYDNPLLLN